MIPYPEQWLENMRGLLGEEYEDFRASLDREHFAGLRLNPLRLDRSAAAAEKYTDGIVPWYPEYGRYVSGGRPGSDIAHFSGAYYMQDPSAMSAVAVLDPQPGEKILDLCAAPGGKSGQIAEKIGCKGLLISNEIDLQRARMLSGNLERLGVTNALIVSARPDVLAAKWKGFFDAVLCDAPCSGEGMFRRDENARSEWDPRSPEGCAVRQRQILACAVEMLRPGGRLVYSTCTFNRTENEENIAWLTDTYPQMQTEDFKLAGVGESTNGCIRLWPHRIDGEGHFAARLRKSEDEPVKSKRSDKNRTLGKRIPECPDTLERLFDEIGCIPDNRLKSLLPHMNGDRLLLVPKGLPDTDGIYVLRCGLQCAKVGRSHIEPEHALAMALKPDDFGEIIELDDKQTEVWITGGGIEASLQGRNRYVWVCHNGMPLSWGKYSDGIIKNKLPKGLIRAQ